jgi:glycerol-3-phosphate cytidylyltransferase
VSVHAPPPAAAPRPSAPAVVGYAPGVFDLFHVGHLNLLRRARLACDYLIAGVLADDTTWEQKGRRPVVPEHERLEIVRACRYVDDVHLETTTDKLATWEIVRFDRIFKGDDWQGTPRWVRLGEQFAARGVEVAYLPYTRHVSSTLLHDAQGIDEGRPARAAQR